MVFHSGSRRAVVLTARLAIILSISLPIILPIILPLAGCAPSAPSAPSALSVPSAPPVSQDGSQSVIDVSAVWARPAGAGSATAVYFVIENSGGQDDLLLGAETAAGAASIHRTVHEDGIARMREVPEGLAVAAGETVAFEPMAYHVMLADLVETLEAGEEFDLTLHFQKAGAKEVSATIANAPPE